MPFVVQLDGSGTGERSELLDHVRLVIEAVPRSQAGPVRVGIVVGRGDGPVQARDAVMVLRAGSGGLPDDASQVALRHAQPPGDRMELDVGLMNPADVVQPAGGKGRGA